MEDNSKDRPGTDVKQTEEALTQLRERFRALSEATFEAIFISEKGICIETNKAAEKIFGYTYDELIGIFGTDVIAPESRELVKKNILAGYEKPYEAMALRKNGTTFPAEFQGKMFEYQGKNVRVTAVRDITERKRMNTEKAELQKQLLHSQKMEAIGTLAGGIAHDFNNLLSIIFGFAELARDKIPEGNTAGKELEQVLKAADRAKDLVSRILSFSRKTELEKKPVRFSSVITDAVTLLRATIPTTIEINMDIREETAMVFADPTHLHQVIVNLCTNAYHAMQESGGIMEITLTGVNADSRYLMGKESAAGRYLMLTVRDTGRGIPEENIKQIFDPFFTTKGVGEGVGLGLSTVHGIIKDHNGDISVTSKPGEGATFRVLLPRIESPEVTDAAAPTPVTGGAESILFVDDEETMTYVVMQVLEKLGYEVTAKTSSMDALNVFREAPDSYDLVMADYAMPEMTGIELAKEILNLRPDVPIILCTGYLKEEELKRAMDVGIRTKLMKPLTSASIAKAVREVLDDSKWDPRHGG